MPKNSKAILMPQNRILAALSAPEYERILPHLELTSFSYGEVVYEPGELMEYIFFPTTSVVAMLYTMENGATAQMGLVGNEGVVGIAIFMGGDTVPNRALVQVAGSAIKMRAKILREEFALGDELQHLLLRYTQVLLTQVSQTAVCNRLHTVEQHLCRWLLLSRERIQTDSLHMTQEFIANTLGVRREGITVAAGRLQDAGLISYSRGRIKILDRQGLEASVCECYWVVKGEFERLFG